MFVFFNMATGGKKTLSSSRSVKDSDFVFDFTCNPCENEGNDIEAINFCEECSEHFCLACTQDHNKFRGTSGHTVVNVSLANKVDGATHSSGLLLNEVCREHNGEHITTYCADHDLVLCNTCVSVNHTLCRGVSYIPNVAGVSKHSDDINTMRHEMCESLEAVCKTQLSLQNLLTSADEEKKEQLKRIRDCTERLIKHARDLEKTATDDVNGCHKTTTDKLRSEVRSLDNAKMTIEDRLKSIDNANANSDAQVFVDLKRGRQEVDNVRRLTLNLTSAPTGKAIPDFVMREELDYFLKEVRWLGQYDEKKATLYAECDVRMSGDNNVCLISDSCELPDGTMIITDTNNNCIKKLDKSYKTTECLNLKPSPYGISQAENDEVVVTLTSARKVQFVKVRGKLKKTRSFKVSTVCRGIICSRGELFVSCGGYFGDSDTVLQKPGFVAVYSMSGILLRKLQLNHRGQHIFSNHITLQLPTTTKHSILLMRIVESYPSTDKERCALHSQRVSGNVLEHDKLLVCGFGSNNVIQIRADGEMVAQLLGEEDEVNKPTSLMFLRGSFRLVVAQHNSDKIKVFDLKL